MENDISISSLCEEAAATAAKSGFSGQSFPEFVALVHTELSEALEEYRAGRLPDETHYSRPSEKVKAAILDEVYGPGPVHADLPFPKGFSFMVPCPGGTAGAKPEGIPSELADVVIRVAHFCGANGIDLAAAVREKVAFNKTRPFKHGGKKL